MLYFLFPVCSTCYMGRWKCTEDKCSSTCSYYGMSHVSTFDGLEYEFEASKCGYALIQVSLLSYKNSHVGYVHLKQHTEVIVIRDCFAVF